MGKLRLDILTYRTYGCARRLDSLWQSIRKGKLHDSIMRDAIIEEYRAIADRLLKIHDELKRELPPEGI